MSEANPSNKTKCLVVSGENGFGVLGVIKNIHPSYALSHSRCARTDVY